VDETDDQEIAYCDGRKSRIISAKKKFYRGDNNPCTPPIAQKKTLEK